MLTSWTNKWQLDWLLIEATIWLVWVTYIGPPKNQLLRQSQIVQSAIDSSGTEPHKYSPLLRSHLVCIYLGSLPGLFPLGACMFQGCIFIQGPKIMYNYCLSRQLLNYKLIRLRSVSTRSIEGKQPNLANIILHWWMSFLKDWLN